MIFILLIIFQLKHFIADYLLQGKYMLGKFKDKGWALPLAAHCFVHFVFTFVIALISTSNISSSLALSLFDFTIHFVMDRIKASSKLLGRYQAISKAEFTNLMEKKSVYEGLMKFVGEAEKDSCDNFKENIKEIEKRFKSNVYFWYSLGLDQMVHHLTDIAIIYFIMGSL